MFNEIEVDFDDMAIRTFKVGLPTEYDLRKSLTEKLDSISEPKRTRVEIRLTLSFSNEDKIGTIQPHVDALVVILRIGGYDVKRVMVDQGSGAEIMYLDLYNRLGLKPEDLIATDSPLVSFDEKVVILKGQIRLPVQAGSKVVEVDFIKEELVEFLRRNVDVFVWSAYETPGVDPDLICHHLNINPSVIPKKQPPQRLSKEHSKVVKEEVNKLKQVEAIKKVFYDEWLTNTVVVKKKNGKWRVCVNFTDLNKACPNDPFPIPRIDQLVDAIVGHPRISFLDAFQGYHQIPLALDDQEETAFVTPTENYHCKRMMTRMFKPQLGKNIEVYIDNMVVKSKVVFEHVGNLRNIFEVLRKHKLRLNASKCSFGVGSGKFLGYMATHRGIELNLIKSRLVFSAINNKVEYEALLAEMAMVLKMGRKAVEIFLDSRLVIGQVKGELEARDVRMQEYLNQVKRL
nr:uncharacterized protein LOC112040561 [Quercus suber]